MSCKKCGEDIPIVNKFFGLCFRCNNERLHGNPFGKVYNYTKPSKKSLKGAKKRPKKGKKEKSLAWIMMQENKPKIIEEKSDYELDNEFYEKCFNTFDHKCEECGAKQPEEFLTSDGKVAARLASAASISY